MKDPGRRARIWRHLAAYPGLTASEIHRAALTDITEPAVRYLCRRMAAAGQLTSTTGYSPQQGRPVTRWHPAPGAFL
jgi:hypothetical protein